MDAETRFISALLRAKRSEQRDFYAKQIARGVFRIKEAEINWVYKHRERTGEYPSRYLYEQKFGPLRRHRDPLAVCLQDVLDMDIYEQMKSVQAKTKKSLDDNDPVSVAMQIFRDGANQITSHSVSSVDVDFSSTTSSVARYREMVRIRNEGGKLMTTPWPSLNKLVKYFLPGEVVDIVARTSMGKTWVALNLAAHVASEGWKVLVITKEMTTERLTDRLECLKYKLAYDSFREGTLSPAVVSKWARSRLKEPLPDNLIISGEETVIGTGLAHVVSKIDQYNPDLVVLDGAYLIVPEGVSPRAQDTEKLKFLSNRLKAITLAKRVVMVPVIQMNRQAEGKDGEVKGSLGAIYGSDAWAQDADYLLDLGGKRGSNYRTLSLLKGRESNIGEFNIEFALSPYPKFNQTAVGAHASQASFTGVS